MKFTLLFLLFPIMLSSQTMNYQGKERAYRLHVPNYFGAKKSLPLLIVLHGGGGNARRMGKFTGFSQLADRDTFIAVYPQAYKNHWNDGRGNSKFDSQKDNVDDVGFISALIDTLCRQYPISVKKIYVTGLSNGGMMCFRLGCELGGRIAAIAPVIANMPLSLFGQCNPPVPLSVLIMNGTEDPLMPYGGGEVHFRKRELGKVVSATQSLLFWRTHNACKTDSIALTLPDTDPDDGCTTTMLRFSCTSDTEVIRYTIHGGGHNMPGCLQYLPRSLIGRTSHDFNGAEVIWNFFVQH
jgi:polyhydroxybutyrate depolymerase